MSYKAVNSVTQGLQTLLHSQLVKVSSTAVVTLLPPGDSLPEASGLNLYLYRVAECACRKNEPWRGDRVTPPSSQPALSLVLYYLLTPLGKRPQDPTASEGDDAHDMLGVAMQTLHAHPVLNDIHLPDFDADLVLPDFLQNSFEKVTVRLMPTTVEELSRIWATINRPYRLSVAYEVSLVQIRPTVPPLAAGGVVLQTELDIITLDPPRLSGLTPPRGAVAHIEGTTLRNNDLRIDGFGLSFPGQRPLVTFGGKPVAVTEAPPGAQSLTVALPVNPEAGPDAEVRVKLNGRTSQPQVFSVTPWVSRIVPVRTAIEAPGAQLMLEGTGFTPQPRAVRFELDSPPPPLSPPAPALETSTSFEPGGSDARVAVPIPAGLVNGRYLVRMVLNDAANSASNSRPLEVIPRLDPAVNMTKAEVNNTQVHELTLSGARLAGNDTRLVLDGAVYSKGRNQDLAEIVFTLGKLLRAGRHQLFVQIDGYSSHPVEFSV